MTDQPDRPDGLYRLLVWAALATLLAVVGATTYHYIFQASEEGNLEYRRGNLRLEDGEYRDAMRQFETVLAQQPDHAPSHLGRALALMQLDRPDEALTAFDMAIQLAPGFAAAYADRGILLDRLGKHEAALEDYRKALALNPKLSEGPGWLVRFFRMQYDPPPTIADRALYLESELRRPAGERVLRNPEADAAQRMFKSAGAVEDNR